MDKKTYYVSVQASTVLENQGAGAYEFEIQATPEDLEMLYELFEIKREYDDGTFFRTHIPAVPYHLDEDNDGYDAALKEIYNLIGKLGTPETSKHISQMQLDGLGTPY
ncbi:hypothetical protein [Paenibacillus gansuensis]|uniref:Hydrolase n=1 Tax=Paenibacillus gansuensis TaxID=306542 RepID=A0ABW5PJP8_9BACL